MAIVTAPGERVMRPQFGCRIWDLLFEPINANTLGLMAEAVRDTVSQWEPRVDLEDLEVEPDPASPARVMIRMTLPGAGDERPPQPRLPVLRHPPGASVTALRSPATQAVRSSLAGARRSHRGIHELPVPNLDDRTFQDLVDEAKRLIPTYCPEWTNHNLTDPGVALIELFAWMTELSLFRLNQVPDKFYTHMLNMLGLRAVPGDGGPHRPHVLARRRRRRAGRRAGRHAGQHGRGRSAPPRVFTTLTRPRHHPAAS